jgi:tetratricopeptide (TPR) repeat protein
MADREAGSISLGVGISKLQEELKKNNNDVAAHCRLGWAYYGSGKIDEAVSIFQAARQRWPDEIEVNYGLGLALKAQGKTEEALVSFGRTEELPVDTVRGSMLKKLAAEQKEYLVQKV